MIMACWSSNWKGKASNQQELVHTYSMLKTRTSTTMIYHPKTTPSWLLSIQMANRYLLINQRAFTTTTSTSPHMISSSTLIQKVDASLSMNSIKISRMSS
jgi:hypothetical protein